MCLAIPGQVIEFVDDANRLAKVDVAGVRRNVNVSLLDDEDGGVQPGDWVLIHVGFALSKVDEEEAHATLELLRGMGGEFEERDRGAQGQRDRMSEALPACIADFDGCITCGDHAVELRVVSIDDARGLAVCADELRRRASRSTSCSSRRSTLATSSSSTPGRPSRGPRR